MKQTILLIFLSLLTLLATSQNAWINEIHYDNDETDVDELIEIVIENVESFSLADFSVTLYNGTDGESYSTISLDQWIAGETLEGFSIFYYNYTANGFSIQNGDPDGMALTYQDNLITGQFLSYEGAFTATNGPATGQSSMDIGVAEPGDTGQSLQLSGNGTQYSHFAWEEPASATAGFANNAQTFGTIAPDPEPDNHVTAFSSLNPTWYSISLQWTDATGENLPTGYLVKFSTTSASDIIAPTDGVAEAENDSVQNIDFTIEQAVFYTLAPSQNYFFKIWPYSNTDADIDYKLDGEIPTTADLTLAEPNFINHETFETGDLGSWSSWSSASDKDWVISNALNGAIGTEWSAQINGYQENEPSNDWLISPQIAMSNYTYEKMCFYSQWKYGSTMDELSLNYSIDYTGGDPAAASWTAIPFTKPGTDETWAFSDTINLAAITNSDVYLAFQYQSNGSPRRWNVDEIQIIGQEIQEIDVLTPQTNDEWITGNSHDITWVAGSSTVLVDILYTLDASSPTPVWFMLQEDVDATSGLYSWNIPESQSISTDYQIKIEDQDNPIIGYSGVFSIINPPFIPLLVINEIMYNPPEGIGADEDFEFIEIYNNEEEAVDLNGFTIVGDVDFTFPSETVLQPGEYLVVAANPDSIALYYNISDVMGPYTGLLRNDGGLVAIGSAGSLIVDEVGYDITAPWPEAPNGSGPSMELMAPNLDNRLGASWGASFNTGGTPGAINSLITDVQGIVISELFYNPPGNDYENIEYIEIYNSNAAPMNLGGCSFTQGIDFIFPPVTLQSGDYLVVTKSLNDFVNVFGLPAYQWTSGDLNNITDTLEIKDIPGNVIDYVAYDSELPWDTLAAGFGPSLELMAPNIDNTLAESWNASTTLSVVLPGNDSIWCSPYDGFVITPPEADFEADITTIYVSQDITFTDLCTGDPDFFAWSFPGGTPDSTNEVIPHITYHVPGTYSVTLFVSNIFGEDTETKEDFITVLPMPDPPIADFGAIQTTIFVGDTVDYTDLSQNSPTEWLWTFEGGIPASSPNQNPQDIVYNTPGKFDVSLRAINIAGEDFLLKENYITVLDTTTYNLIISEIMYNPPETDTDSLEFIEIYNADDQTVKLEGYYFKGIGFTFPPFEIAPGEYILIAGNSVAMQNTFNIWSFDFDGGFLDNNGEPISFYTPTHSLIDSVSYDDNAPWPIEADGNGSSLVLCDPSLNNNLPESWSASLDFAATNANGDTIWASPGAPCGNVPSPIAQFYGEPTAGSPGMIVQYFDISENDPQTWIWNFPGGIPESSTEQNPEIQYPNAGDFDVTLTVTNTWGSDIITKTGYIHIGVGNTTFQEKNIKVFPNPSANGAFQIALPYNDEWSYTVKDLRGKTILSEQFYGNEKQLLLKNYADGLYLLQINNAKNDTFVIKLIKN